MGDSKIASAKTTRIIIIKTDHQTLFDLSFPADSSLLHSSFIDLHFSMICGITSDMRSNTPFSLIANN